MRRLAALAILLAGCPSAAPAPRRPADDYFADLQSEDPRRAFEAVSRLAPLLTAEDLPRVEALLEGRHAERALLLLREARLAAAEPILEKDAARLLDPARPDLAKVALGTFGALRVRGTSPAVRQYYLSQGANETAALKALGRIWDRKLGDPPLAGEAEHERLRTLQVVLGVAMRAADAPACEATLKIMTGEELKTLLTETAPRPFAAAEAFAEAAARPDFDPGKGALIHGALLSNPNPHVVALILWSSPWRLDVWDLLRDERMASLKGVADARVCDYAAARLEAEDTKKVIRLADSQEEREDLLAKWRSKRPR